MVFEDIRGLEVLLGTLKREELPESAAYASFDKFCDAVEELTGRSIDGHEERDGCSLESAYDGWLSNFTPAEYASGKRAE